MKNSKLGLLDLVAEANGLSVTKGGKLSTKLMNKNKLITKGEVYKIINDRIKIEKKIQKDYKNCAPFSVLLSEARCDVLLVFKRELENYGS